VFKKGDGDNKVIKGRQFEQSMELTQWKPFVQLIYTNK
jgi:hypothetical protein